MCTFFFQTWHDMKSATKTKKSLLKRHQEGTGGGPPSHIKINDEDEEILEIIGKVAAEGDPHVKESQAEFYDQYSLSNISHDHEYTFEDENEFIEAHEEVVHIPMEKKEEPDVKIKKQTTTTDGRQTRTKRLENSIIAREKLATLTQTKIALKEQYYNNKLNVLKEELEVKRRIAKALEAIAVNLKK